MKAHRDETTGRWHTDLPDVFDLICEKLRNREPFSFARYGDGEWNAIYGKRGANCDGHEYFPDMGERLREIVASKPTYMMGMQPLTVASDRIHQIQQDFPGINWVDADSIHNASIDGILMRMFSGIVPGPPRIVSTNPICAAEPRVIIVGPYHLRRFAINFEIDFFEIPSRSCWTYHKETANYLHNYLSDKHEHIILLCASMMSEVIIDDFKDSGHTFIDIGSAFDPYCGVKSRRYHHKLNINAGQSQV